MLIYHLPYIIGQMDKYTKLFKQVFLFGLVGGVSFLIDLGVTTALYDFVHFPAFLSAGIGFISAFFFNFPVNRKHVFNHSNYDKYSVRRQMVLYFCLSIFNMIITSALTQLIVGAGLTTIGIAKVCLTILIAAWNFVIFRLIIFSKRPNAADLDSLIVQ